MAVERVPQGLAWAPWSLCRHLLCDLSFPATVAWTHTASGIRLMVFNQQMPTHLFTHSLTDSSPIQSWCEAPAWCQVLGQALSRQEGFQKEVVPGLSECWSACKSVPAPLARFL